jgi:hypothetical protein
MLNQNNWIYISWDGLPIRQAKENLRVVIQQQAKSIKPFAQVCDEVARDIANRYNNLYLALSGGSDSENIANVLVRNNIPFTPLIVEYDHLTNSTQIAETWWAMHWCKHHKIQPLIVRSADYVGSTADKQRFLELKPRLTGGAVTVSILIEAVQQKKGKLITGNQLEYYPDNDQMMYLESQLGNYQGFVMEESDQYLEALLPDQHPWAFHYWNADIMAAFVNQWDTNLSMQENKSAIYGTPLRPKISYPPNFLNNSPHRVSIANTFGTLDCALLGTKQSLLQKLVK